MNEKNKYIFEIFLYTIRHARDLYQYYRELFTPIHPQEKLFNSKSIWNIQNDDELRCDDTSQIHDGLVETYAIDSDLYIDIECLFWRHVNKEGARGWKSLPVTRPFLASKRKLQEDPRGKRIISVSN